MAYATKYTLSWHDYDDTAWEVDFQEDGFGGSETALTPGAAPMLLRYNQSEKYQPIVGSSIDFQILYDSSNDLYVEGNRDLKVIVKRGATTRWQGYVTPGQYLWKFNDYKTFVTITATDGLGELKNIKFEDGSGDPYYGQAQQAVVIANILLKTGLTLQSLENINIFDTNHTGGTGNSPLDQTYIYQEAYWDEETDERANCYDVLSDILTNYGACIKQAYTTAVYWHIFRPNSFSMDTLYYNIFTSAGVYASSGSVTSYNTIDSNHYYIHADQEITKRAGVNLCEVTQRPPRRKNMIRNGSFDSFTWTGGVPDYWTDTYSSGTSLDISEDGGTLKMGSCGNSSNPTEYLEMIIEIEYAQSITLSFDWTPTYAGSPTYKNLMLQMYDGSNYLTTSGWQGSPGFYAITAGTSGTADYASITIPDQYSYGFSRYIQFTFRIYEFYNENAPASNYFKMDNLKLEVESSVPDYKLHSYESAESINNIKKLDVPLGDTWRSDLFGTPVLGDDVYFVTNYNSGATPTTEWGILGDPTTDAPLCEVLARQNVEGFRRSVDLFRGSIRATGFDMGFKSFEDSDFVDEYNFEKRYLPLDITYNARTCVYNGEWIECPATYTDEGMEWASCDAGNSVPYYTITGNQLEVRNWTSAGDGYFAYFDTYTAVAGETVRIVLNLVDDGGSYIPFPYLGDGFKTRSWGLNYYTVTFTTAGSKIFNLYTSGVQTVNFTATMDIYSITGV